MNSIICVMLEWMIVLFFSGDLSVYRIVVVLLADVVFASYFELSQPMLFPRLSTRRKAQVYLIHSVVTLLLFTPLCFYLVVTKVYNFPIAICAPILHLVVSITNLCRSIQAKQEVDEFLGGVVNEEEL